MAKQGRTHDEEAWRNAKKVCRLNARQVEMARVLGMNPKKLPGLRPSPQQRWKLPVGEFIEQRYWKRLGHPRDHNPEIPEPGSRAQAFNRGPHASDCATWGGSPAARCTRGGTRQGCGVAGGRSGLLPYESRRRSAEVARAGHGRPGGTAESE